MRSRPLRRSTHRVFASTSRWPITSHSKSRSLRRKLEVLHAAQPEDHNIALLLADCYLRSAAFSKAVDLLAPIEPVQQDNDALAYVLGMALIRDGRVDEGQKRVDRILRKGESAEGHFLLGSALFMANNFPGAVQEFTEAARLNPNVSSLQSFLGQALLATGDADGAVQAFRKELASNPNDFDANFQLASILAHRGEAAEARRLLEHAAQVRPGSVAARKALAEGFDFPQTAQAPGGIAVGAAAPAIGSRSFAGGPRPVVLVFGSYTCPKFRGSAEALKQLSARYHDRADFLLVYIREAHSDAGTKTDWESTINQREGISLQPARTLAEKQEHADLCKRKLHLPFASTVDGMDQRAEKAYDAWPSRVYLVGRDGRVAFNTRLGELDFHPAQLDAAIRETLSKGTAHGSSH